uniref:Uncharacterized protein n=1 Tax=Rhizophora mucronata TaxID=61149 RepID=A0A2P2NEM3_RHIMU
MTRFIPTFKLYT